jgi:hypothetical protein
MEVECSSETSERVFHAAQKPKGRPPTGQLNEGVERNLELMVAALMCATAVSCGGLKVLNTAPSVNRQGGVCDHIAQHVTSLSQCKWLVDGGFSPRRAGFSPGIVHVEFVVQAVLG